MDTKVLSSGIRYSKLPESYIRPESDRPRLSEVSKFEGVPIIDLGSHNRTQIVQLIGEACSSYGFFQVHFNIIIHFLLKSLNGIQHKTKNNHMALITIHNLIISFHRPIIDAE